MAFSVKAFFRFTRRLLSRFRDPSFRWTPRRVGIFLALYLLYPLLELVIWTSFWLDDLFFPGYRWVEVHSPVFIVGNFRSGTTLLHRLLAKDVDRFSTMTMWEILLAPSILLRKVVGAWVTLDRWLGGLLAKRVSAMEKDWRRKNVMHKVSLGEPEEDDYLLLHIWSALTIGLSSGLLEEAWPYAHFDTALPRAERTRILAFYRRCLQRHLYAHRSSRKQYLAKNPALIPKLNSIYECFPDAKIIGLVRNPLEVVPSYVDMMQYSWRVLGDPVESDAARDFVVDLMRHWYSYLLEWVALAPRESFFLLRYDDLVADPQRAATDIYDHFGFDMSPSFAQVLQVEAAQARRFRSRHDYSLGQTGLTCEQIVTKFQDVFDRFGFDTGEEVGEAELQPTGRPSPASRPWTKQKGARPAPSRPQSAG